MPPADRHIYKPSFSIPVSPESDLSAPYTAPGAPPAQYPGAVESVPSNSSETPFNTTEIGPTSMNSTTPTSITVPATATARSYGTVGSTASYSTTTTSSTIATAPPYAPSSAPIATSGGASVTPLDPGAGKVAGDGLADSSSALGAAKTGVTPAISP